jgi:hypothetical protein
MKPKQQFSDELRTLLSESKGLRIRAGTTHRFIGIWVVVVKDRVFVRSWSVKANGWYKTFLEDSSGAIHIDGDEIAIRAVPIKDKRLRDAIDQAYLDKYNSKGSLKYAKDLGSAKSRATTIELVPIAQ